MSTSAGLAIETLLWDSTVCFQQTWVPKCRKAPGGLGQFASQGLDIPSPARSSGCRECQVPGAALCIPPLSPPCRIPGSQCSKTLMVPGCPPAGDKMSSSSIVRKPTLHRYISTKVLLAEGRETPFAEHCRNYENTYRVWDRQGGRGGKLLSLTAYCCASPLCTQMLQTEIQGLKDQVQELHRDLTKHHSLIRTEIMSEILQKSLQMDVQIAAHYSSVEMMRSVFEEVRGQDPFLPPQCCVPVPAAPVPTAGLGGDVPEGGQRAGDLRRYS